jgi:hypothetical protein
MLVGDAPKDVEAEPNAKQKAGAAGGKARVKSTTAAKRSEIARKAAVARWKK